MENKTPYKPTVLEVLRRQQGISQTELAREVGLFQVDISNMENGLKTPTSEQKKAKIATLLGLCDQALLLETWLPGYEYRGTGLEAPKC